MAITIRELKMLREVLLTITNITLSTRETLVDISKHQPTSSDGDRLKKEIKNLDMSITTTRALLAFYENRIQEEIERGEVRRHMEDARVLCGAIREIRREQREQMGQREQLARQERLVSAREEKTPEEREREEVARYKAGYMSKEQVLEVARKIKECEEAKALKRIREQEEDKENLEEDEMTLVDDAKLEQHGSSSIAILHRISTSLQKATKRTVSGSVTSGSKRNDENNELGSVGRNSKGSLSRMMRSMSLRSRGTSDYT